MEEVSRLFSDMDYKRVALTEIGPYVVSTVWIGLDHNFGNGPPLIFETMVFTATAWAQENPALDFNDPDKEHLLELDCYRYATEYEARKGHEDVVTLIRATYIDPEEGLNERSTHSSPPRTRGGPEEDGQRPPTP